LFFTKLPDFVLSKSYKKFRSILKFARNENKFNNITHILKKISKAMKITFYGIKRIKQLNVWQIPYFMINCLSGEQTC